MSRSVLLVDDEPGILEIAGAYLRREGFLVRTAGTGTRALEAFATQVPDVVVLDLMLPDMSGEEVCVALRRTSAVPILMLTAKAAEARGGTTTPQGRSRPGRAARACARPCAGGGTGAPPPPICWSSTGVAWRSTSRRTRRRSTRPSCP